MDLKVGQKIKVKSPLSVYSSFVGEVFIVEEVHPSYFRVRFPPPKEHLTMPFMNDEFATYFEKVDTREKKCDCGFISGVSAVHYRWCEVLSELKSA